MPTTSSRRSSLLALGLLLGAAAPVRAAEAVFIGERRLALTRQVMDGAAALGRAVLPPGSAQLDGLVSAGDGLGKELDRVLNGRKGSRRSRWLKTYAPPGPLKLDDTGLAEALRNFNDHLRELVRVASATTPIPPSFNELRKVAAEDLAQGLDSRLAAYQVRFGTASERINFIELGLGAAFLSGDESGPSPWEPIARLTPVSFSGISEGPISTFQLGLNHYFLDGPPTGALSWLRVQNHLGLALALAYPDAGKVFHWQGKPAWGVILHLDKAEVGLTVGGTRKQVGATIGYAFQFVPMTL